MFQLMLIEYLLYFAWSLLSICMMAPVMLQIILNAVCSITPKCINLKELGKKHSYKCNFRRTSYWESL